MINLQKEKKKKKIGYVWRENSKKKILSTTEGNVTHDLPNTGWILYLFTKGSYNTA